MKKLLFLLALSIGMTNFVNAQEKLKGVKKAHTPDLEWLEVGNVSENKGMAIFKKAIATSKKDKKLILAFFTSSVWCAPCKKIHKELLHAESFKELVRDEFVLVKGDLLRNPVKKAPPILKRLMAMFNKNKSVPCLVVIDDNGKVVKKMDGYKKPEEFMAIFKKVIANQK